MSFLDHLPETLREIAEVVGLEPTLRLVQARGGQRIYIPAFLPHTHWLIDLMGREHARALCDHYRVMPGNRAVGAEVELPIWRASAIDQARAEAHAALAQAEADQVSVNEAVRRSRLSRRTVLRSRQARKQGTPLPPLLALLDEKTSE